MPHQIQKIPTNISFQMDMHLLEQQIELDKAHGLKPCVVVASSGTTNTGSIDDLLKISDLCKRENIWMHIDGAYGASVLLSEKYKHLLNGVKLADSISWDPHKWLFQTYSCSVLLVRNRQYLYDSFHVNPEYLKDATIDEEQVNYWDLGPELTRPARAFKLWFTLKVAGTTVISNAISHGVDMAQYIEDKLLKDHEWQIISPANMAIINFRYFDKHYNTDELDTINSEIAELAIKEGKIGVLSIKINDLKVLRICTIHPQAEIEQMDYLIDLLKKYARKIVKNIQKK